jgi:hypothetical protein
MHEAIPPFLIHLQVVVSNECSSENVVFPEVTESHLTFSSLLNTRLMDIFMLK